jgi:hypothetical protein
MAALLRSMRPVRTWPDRAVCAECGLFDVEAGSGGKEAVFLSGCFANQTMRYANTMVVVGATLAHGDG